MEKWSTNQSACRIMNASGDRDDVCAKTKL